MDTECSSYYNADGAFRDGFACPRPGNAATALYCCGFNDDKYCCDDSKSFYPYDYGYMMWLSIGAMIGLSIAAVVVLACLITLCVLCYLFITTKPSRLDNGLPLRAPRDAPLGSSHARPTCAAGPRGFGKNLMSRKLDRDNQLLNPDILFQRCLAPNVTSVNVEDPP